MFQDPVHQAVIGICALVVTLEPLPSLIPCYAQGDTVFGTEFLQLGHDAGCDDGGAFGVEEVHERGLQFKLAAHRVGEEIGVYEDGVGRDEGGVGLEEEGRGGLRTMLR